MPVAESPGPRGAHGPGYAGAILAALDAQRTFVARFGDSMEHLLSVLAYMIPVHDEEDDRVGFWNQAIYSASELFGIYRSMLLRSIDSLPVVACGAAASGAADVSKAAAGELLRRRVSYLAGAFSLRVLRSVQVLIEMYAVRARGAQWALRVCLQVEVVKLALKLFVQSRTPFAFYVDEEALEEVESAGAVQQAPSQGLGGSEVHALGSGGAYVGRRSGKTLRAIREAPRAPANAEVAGPALIQNLLVGRTAASLRILAAEALFHGRPFVHLQLLLRRGPRSWLTWFVSFLVDRISLALLAPSLLSKSGTRASTLEDAELRRRRRLLWWALARSPFFDRFLQRPCEGVNSFVRRVPVLNYFNFVELALAIQPFYFTTSGS